MLLLLRYRFICDDAAWNPRITFLLVQDGGFHDQRVIPLTLQEQPHIRSLTHFRIFRSIHSSPDMSENGVCHGMPPPKWLMENGDTPSKLGVPYSSHSMSSHGWRKHPKRLGKLQQKRRRRTSVKGL